MVPHLHPEVAGKAEAGKAEEGVETEGGVDARFSVGDVCKPHTPLPSPPKKSPRSVLNKIYWNSVP